MNEGLTGRFEDSRNRLRAVAYRMLGSLSEAEDAVQESWLKLSRADTSDVANLEGWLTTVTARVCLDMLRSRKSRREEPETARMPDPIVSREDAMHPEHETMVAGSVGLALIVVLDTLDPDERLAFVLHDMFDVPFDEIATIVDRTPEAARQLASRGRRRVQDAAPVPDVDRARQRIVVNAFLAASRKGDFEALVNLLHPDVVLRGDRGGAGVGVMRGFAKVSKAVSFGAAHADPNRREVPVLVNGGAGQVVFVDGKTFSVVGFTVVDDKIVEINVLADPVRLATFDLSSVT